MAQGAGSKETAKQTQADTGVAGGKAGGDGKDGKQKQSKTAPAKGKVQAAEGSAVAEDLVSVDIKVVAGGVKVKINDAQQGAGNAGGSAPSARPNHVPPAMG